MHPTYKLGKIRTTSGSENTTREYICSLREIMRPSSYPTPRFPL